MSGERVEVIQADRDAADQLDDDLGFLTERERPIVEQAFARHRLAAAPTSPSDGAEVERLKALVAGITAGRFDELEAAADKWAESVGVQRMMNAMASVFEKHASQEIMDRFRAKLFALMHLAFVEGAAQGVLQARAALNPNAEGR